MVKKVYILLSSVLIFSLFMPTAFAQYYEAVLDLDPIPSQVFVGDTITFSGKLSTTDGHVIQEATVSIKDDVTLDIDTVLGTLTTDDDGKFTGDWEAKLRLDGGAYDFYAYYDGASDISYARSQTHSVTVFTASGSSYVPSSTSSFYEPTEITLNSIPKTVSIGQTITFSGKLTSNGLPLQNAEIWIKDEDPFDLDDYLASAITDSQGRYTAKWTVTDVESGDRKYSSAALGAYYMVPLSSANDLLNAAEFNTIEIFAVFEQDESEFQESNTCIPRYTDDETYLPCSNNVIVISNPVDLESKILGMLLGGGVSDSDIIYSILGSDDPSDLVLDEFEDVLLEAIQDELGINQDLSMEQMLELLDDPSLASQYQSQSSPSAPNPPTSEPKTIEPAREVTSWPPEQTQEVTTTVRSDTRIPDWVKNNAGWWASGKLSDSDFTNGIEYLIENDIIVISDLPQSTGNSNEKIPDWVRFNASWWAAGLITEDEFVEGIQFLVEQGIIRV